MWVGSQECALEKKREIKAFGLLNLIVDLCNKWIELSDDLFLFLYLFLGSKNAMQNIVEFCVVKPFF
jgi:hypothetical protein